MAVLTVVSLASRALILPALAWGVAVAPPFAAMFFGALALLHAPVVVPLPAGGGGLHVPFVAGFAGGLRPPQASEVSPWRLFPRGGVPGRGVAARVRDVGSHAG